MGKMEKADSAWHVMTRVLASLKSFMLNFCSPKHVTEDVTLIYDHFHLFIPFDHMLTILLRNETLEKKKT
jgi:hypothetical protein